MGSVAKVNTTPLEWVVPSDLPSTLATHLSIVQTEHETTLTFFQATLPPYQLLEATTTVQARAVSRVVIATSRLREFADIFDRVADAREESSRGTLSDDGERS